MRRRVSANSDNPLPGTSHDGFEAGRDHNRPEGREQDRGPVACSGADARERHVEVLRARKVKKEQKNRKNQVSVMIIRNERGLISETKDA